MKSTLIIAAVGAILTIYLSSYHSPVNYSEAQWESEFMNYVSEYRKSYASKDEFSVRRELFKQNYI
jgi:C1A family cysteine protease